MNSANTITKRTHGVQSLAAQGYGAGLVKAVRLIRTGRIRLLVAIPLYRLWWRMRGLDFGMVSTDELGLDPELACYHQDGGGPLLGDVLDQLPITPADVALDFGSGKGGAMATLARYPFRRVDGVEISAPLVEAARRNLGKLQLTQCRLFLADATAFTELDDYTYIFMYNPFFGDVMARVLDNIRDSLRRRPRMLHLIYGNPRHEPMILDFGAFRKVLTYQPYPGYRACVYCSEADWSG